MHRRLVASLFLACALAASLAALEVPGFSVPLSRFGAMGGSHVALADDYGLLFANPAALASARPQLFLTQVGAQATGPLFDIAQAFLGGGSMLESFTSVLRANDFRLFAAADLAGPLSFGYVGSGLGFGLFNRSHALIDAAGISSVGLRAEEEILLVGGYAYGLDIGKRHRLEAGILAKGFARGGITSTMDALSLMNVVSDPLGLPFQLTTGIGVDIGIRWAWDIGLAAGLSCRDLYSPALVSSYSSLRQFLDDPGNDPGKSSSPATLPRDLSLGIGYTMPRGGLWGLVDGLVLALDYRRILDLFSPFPRNAILNLGLGMEARMLDIVVLRGGISEGYLNAGISLDLTIARLNLAFHGSELGQEPGARPAFNLGTSIEFIY